MRVVEPVIGVIAPGRALVGTARSPITRTIERDRSRRYSSELHEGGAGESLAQNAGPGRRLND